MEVAKIASNSSTGSLGSSRGDARISIAKKWADRRKLQETQQRVESGNGENPLAEQKARRSLSPEQPPFSIPPLCVMLRRSWDQTINNLIQHQKNSNAPQKDNKLQARESIQQKPSTSWRSSTLKNENNKRISFPSVLSVLKANAVETIMLAEENETSDKTNGNGLNVLPASYDFTTSAVNHMSDSRSRAFLLLDFSAIVQTHTVWRKRLGIPKIHKDVQMVYSARHNCNARLLQLLQRLGVGLRVATKYDLAAVREATNGETPMIWDDTSILVKPNSFYRNLLLSDNRRRQDNATSAEATRIIPITVGDAQEMERIHNQLHKICKRRRQRQSDAPKLNFVLKLDSTTDDFSKWKNILSKMHETAVKLPHTKVVGVALELCENEDSNVTETGEMKPDTNNCISLLDALSDLIENWVEEELTPETPATTDKSRLPQVHLTNPITATEIDNVVIKWIEQHRKRCNGITIDASRLLMANAAALCTRIIGVKNNESNHEKNGGVKPNGTVPNGQNVAIQQHLYIDDGCYGSLSNYPNEGIPLPLKSQRFMRTLSATSKELVEREQKTVVNTTVWGPTCDGLDKVCSNVTLPRLSRDDWLVFTDLGFCNEGTCFNGFSPPDIACCVLGGNQ